MRTGLQTTFELLATTKNEAAVGVLLPALDSDRARVREGALKALLDRHSPAGQREVLKRLHTFDGSSRKIIEDHRGRMTDALRDAILATQHQTCANGCQAVLWFREYDLIPALINAAEDEANPNRELAAGTLLQLTELLYEEIARPRDYRNRRDPQMVRRFALESLEQSVARFGKHKRTEIMEAFLILVSRDNSTLKQVLADPKHGSYLALISLLTHSERSGVIGLVLSFLDDPQAPSAAITLIAHRSDPRFIDHLLTKTGHEPSPTVTQNLRRTELLSWVSNPEVLDRLDETRQAAAVQLIVRTSVSRSIAFGAIEYLILCGNPGGRRAAAKALAQFNGVEANTLALKALDDRDPEVQASVVTHLRQRGIPGSLTRLIEMIDNPHEVVRRAVQDSLAEFSFKRFLAAYDVLDPEVRRSTGAMVRKIDRDAEILLAEEMAVRSRTRRLRAISIAESMGMLPVMGPYVIGLLTDEDHTVRTEAARALAEFDAPDARQALREALLDRSVLVQEAAEHSLKHLARMELTRG